MPIRSAAHPRSRGENNHLDSPAHYELGSSPLTRGKRDAPIDLGELARLIPAHAGKTDWHLCAFRSGRAHPRSRGENNAQSVAAATGKGSSPLTRGKHAVPRVRDHRPRLIPAHAGKTHSRFRTARTWRAHPRSRGENCLLASACRLIQGSSPLTRGKRLVRTERENPSGLIPAHAGKTLIPALAGVLAGAHPRSRGENASVPSSRRGMTGSSPLTRGKRGAAALLADHGRLIPAHAGKTPKAGSLAARFPAHPRSRGENEAHCLVPSGVYGSSPLTRGKHTARVHTERLTGLIPAHAGKTADWQRENGGKAAHPRSRGENPVTGFLGVPCRGSSPLTRGKHGNRPDAGRAIRLIPAHAGKTSCLPGPER